MLDSVEAGVSTTGGPYEVEVKFVVADAAALAGRLLDAVAEIVEPRGHEVNTLYDDAAGSILARSMVLRVRRDRGARLTLKTPVAGHGAAGEMKVREELEVAVDDGARLQEILGRLGYRPVFTYEKYRATYRLGECTLMLDETPLGTFLEIEGAPGAARATAGALGFDWRERMLDSYGALFAKARARLGFAARDMTFEALAGVTVPPDALR